MTPGQVQRLFQRVMTQLDNGQPESALTRQRLELPCRFRAKASLRPILLEMLLRLFG